MNCIPMTPGQESRNSRAIDAALLCDTAALLQWFAGNARRYGLDPDNPSLRPWIIAAADCALEVGKNPGGLFVYLLRQIAAGDYSKLSAERYDRAKLRLRDGCAYLSDEHLRRGKQRLQALIESEREPSPIGSALAEALSVPVEEDIAA